MAVFNNTVAPGRDDMPNYFRYSSPISGVEADKSSGLALATIGQGIEGTAGLAESTAKDIINKDVRSAVEPIREDFTKTLEAARNAQLGNTIPAPVQGSAGSTGPSLIMSTATPAPAAIDAGLSKVESIQAAMENGKVNDTYYDQRLKSAVVDLRTKYPGFVDYIDQKVSSITGINPANAYAQNLMQDINRAQLNKKTEFDKSLDLARGTVGDGQLPNAKENFQKLQADPSYLPKWQEWYADESAKLGAIKRQETLRKGANMSKEDTVLQRTQDLQLEVSSALHSNLNSVIKITGIDTPKSLGDFIKDAADSAGTGKYSEEQMKELATKMLGQQSVVGLQFASRIAAVNRDANGKPYSYATDLGADVANSIVKNTMEPVYKLMSDALLNKDAGLAFYAMNHAAAMLDRGKDQLLSDKDVGPWAIKMGTFNTVMGPNWTSFIVQSATKNNIDDKMRTYLDNKTLDARLGTGSNMKADLDAADALVAQQKITSPMKSRYMGNLVNLVDDLKNPKAPDTDKQNIVKYIFSPEGQGLLSHIRTEYTGPDGKPVPGKYSVWTRLSSDDIVKEVAKMPQEYKDQYKNYMEREAGKELFQKELLNLNRYTGHDDLHFKYNDGGNGGIPQVELIDAKGKPVVIPRDVPGQWGLGGDNSPAYLRNVDATVQRVNSALAGMSRVERGLGGNPNEYMLQFLQRSQVDLGKNWEGLPGKLMEAIAASRAPSRRIEDTFDDAKGKK